MVFQQAINKAISNPKSLILFDGFGALLSAFLLGVILIKFEHLFGMPPKALYVLAILPCFFAVYDFACYFLAKKNWSLFIKIIAALNLLYCCISIGYVFYHFQKLTILGHLYFVGELIIVLVLVFIEFKTASQLAPGKE